MSDPNADTREAVAKTIGNLVIQTLEQGSTFKALVAENEALKAQVAELQKAAAEAEAAKPAKARA